MNIAIISKSPLYQEVLTRWVSDIPGAVHFGNYETEEEFFNLNISSAVDILIIDYDSDLNSDKHLFKRMSRKYRNLKILIVSMNTDQQFQNSLKKIGADGCIEKYCIDSDLEPAIYKINNGEEYFNKLEDWCA